MSHVYISHSPVDLDPLLKMHEGLRKAGIAGWYPTTPAQISDEGLISRQIANAFAVVVMLSAEAIRSPDVERDLMVARREGTPVIVVRLDKARLGGRVKDLIGPLRQHDLNGGEGLPTVLEDVRQRYHARCPVIAVMNLKGGVGKTTLTAQVFGALQAMERSRVLLIDLDPQYNLTQLFFDMPDADHRATRDQSVISLFERSQLHATGIASPAGDWNRFSREPLALPVLDKLVTPILTGDAPAGRLDLITGQFEISKYAFATDPAALEAIRANFLTQVEALRSQYDLIVMDTNPNATFLTQCVLEAANRVLAPMHPDIYSLRGVRLLNEVISSRLAKGHHPQLSVVFNSVQRREQSTFEADARNGVHDAQAGFELSRAVLGTALPRSGHFVVRAPEEDTPLHHQLVSHYGRGGGLRAVRDALTALAGEIKALPAGRDLSARQAA
ncbi:MAG: AAA family ATPase [Pseudomonadota bacterium]